MRAVWRKDAGEPLRAEISTDPSDRIRVHAGQRSVSRRGRRAATNTLLRWKAGTSVVACRSGPAITRPQLDLWLLEERSPLNRADRIVRPLLIGQGGKDVCVKASEFEQIVVAMQRHGIPVTYVYYRDEGHGLGRPENRCSSSLRSRRLGSAETRAPATVGGALPENAVEWVDITTNQIGFPDGDEGGWLRPLRSAQAVAVH